jgi:nitroreductase
VTPSETSVSFAEVIGARATCRGFLADEVPRSLIEDVLRLAQRSPSWCNTQPWDVIVTLGSQTDDFRNALLEHLDTEEGGLPITDFPKPTSYTGVRLERRRTCGWQLYESVGVRRGDRVGTARQSRRNFELFGAPHVAVITCPDELGVYGAVDCGVYMATFLYAAQSRGLGAAAQAAIANHSPFVRRYFGISDDRRVLCAVSFGYRDETHPANSFRTERADIADIVRWVGEE